MKIENTSSKVIGIGPTTILPGETKEITPEYAANPSIKTYERLGLVRCSGVVAEEDEAEKPAVAPGPSAAEIAEQEEKTHRADLLAEVNAGVDEERLGAIAIELGINTATVKTQAGLLRKVKAELSK